MFHNDFVMPKKGGDDTQKLKVRVVEENTIESVPPISDTENLQETPEDKHSDIGFSEPLPSSGADSQTADADEGERRGTSFLTLTLAFIGGFLIGALLVGGIFYFKAAVLPSQPTPAPSQEPLPIPEATASPEADLTKYKVQALNGSGTAGAALKVKDLLESAGFKDIKTGNAKTYDFTDTEVAMKKDVPDSVFSAIQKALSGYKVTKADNLTDTATYDVVITVGSSKP